MKSFVSKYKYQIVLIVVFALHLCGVLFYFGFSKTFNGDLIYNYDYPYHYYHNLIVKVFYNQGRSWGYNPFLRAGYPVGLAMDNTFLQLLSSFFPRSVHLFILKIWSGGMLLSLPFLFFITIRNFKFSRKVSIIGVFIFLIYQYSSPLINNAIYFGIFNFIFSSVLVIFYLSLFYRFLENKSKYLLIFISLSFPLVSLVHSSFLFICTPALFALFFVSGFKNNRSKIFLLLVYFFSFFVNFYFIFLPFLRYVRHNFLGAGHYYQVNYWWEFIGDLVYSNNIMGNGLNIVWGLIVLFGVFGIIDMIIRRKKIVYLFLFLISYLFIIVYLCSSFPFFDFLKNIQPYRYVVSLTFFLIIPASYFLQEILKDFSYKNFFKPEKAIIVIFIIIILAQVVVRNFGLHHNTLHGLTTKEPIDYRLVKEWMVDNTNRDGRVMIERGLSATKIFSEPSYIYGYLSYETNREILGGPHRNVTFAYDVPSLVGKSMFGESMVNFSDTKLNKLLNLYNVGWVIARSDEAKNELSKQTTIFTKVGEVFDFTFFKTTTDLSFVIGGEADVSSDINIIKISNVKTSDDEIVLKYHWLPTLKATNGVVLEPAYLDNLSVPFIRAKKVLTVSSFDIYNSYKEN